MFDAAAGFGGYKQSGYGRDGGKEVRYLEKLSENLWCTVLAVTNFIPFCFFHCLCTYMGRTFAGEFVSTKYTHLLQ